MAYHDYDQVSSSSHTDALTYKLSPGMQLGLDCPCTIILGGYHYNATPFYKK